MCLADLRKSKEVTAARTKGTSKPKRPEGLWGQAWYGLGGHCEDLRFSLSEDFSRGVTQPDTHSRRTTLTAVENRL